MARYTLNPQMQSWFNTGQAVGALLGQGDFFVGGATYREVHDRLLVIRQLLLWAMEQDKWNDAGEALHEAFRSLIHTRSSIDAYDLVWCYLLVRRDMHEELPIDLDELKAGLQRLHVADSELDADPRLKSLVDAVSSELTA